MYTCDVLDIRTQQTRTSLDEVMNWNITPVAILAVACLSLPGCAARRNPQVSSFLPAPPPPAAAPSNACAKCRIVSFKNDVLPALQESCLACHYDKSQMPGLDLSSAVAYQDLVNHKSRLDPHLLLVKPSSIADSFLFDKLSPKPRFGATMPPYGRPLSPAEKDLLARWIEQGAKDN